MRTFPTAAPTTNTAFISPNLYAGMGLSDSQKIKQALLLSLSEGVPLDILPLNKDRGANLWLVDEAILLPSDATVRVGGLIKQSDASRDNIFRSENVGEGITSPATLKNIRIIGYGGGKLQGADNPRATGDSGKTLSLTAPVVAFGTHSYGTDAGKAGQKQTGDWRNVGVLLAYVDGVEVSGLTVERAHAWGVSLERVTNFSVHDLRFNQFHSNSIGGVERGVLNRDGVDIRLGCKSGRIYNITGDCGDDIIALTGLPHTTAAGSMNSTLVSGTVYDDARDRIEGIDIWSVDASTANSIIRLSVTGVAKMYDINVRDITIPIRRLYTASNGVYIGYNATTFGPITPLGNLSRITIDNIKCFGVATPIGIYGSISESTITNVLSNVASPILYPAGSKGARNLYTANLNGGLPSFLATTPV